ncbi:MAG: hypothetical protein EOQ28_20820 [Mesorhizobium sp.]|uniref:hypothetical protein n=1 Tax=Mesorhizobium sp. TaxID=1871066 RepID=UPI000FEA2FB6|nr:hypothetical protein [Mesorhizobium sp.]RWA70452.1 MAG: hypothetical protein EOQ28_20820 [Mesorhizobium sp.]RWB96317.1 MAG: hypothetical protein EOQ57_27295 [Mesorhizobium sp.]RWK06694.1 MAG: hypothetical protein EOR39_24015 [Mesorhizobium sp.]
MLFHPPPQFILEPPAVIRLADEILLDQIDRRLKAFGLDRGIRRVVIAETRKIVRDLPPEKRLIIPEKVDPHLSIILSTGQLFGSGSGGGGGTPVALTATDHFRDFNGTVTGTNKSLGTTAADRLKAISIAWQDAGTTKTLDTVTVGGASATRIIRFVTGSTDRNVEIWTIDSGSLSTLSASTTANVVVTWSSGNTGVVIQIYKLTGSTATQTSSSGTTSVSVTVPTDGAAIVACMNTGITAASISNVTEDYNQAETASNNMRGIMGSTTTSGALTSTFSDTSSSTRMFAMTFGA